MVEKSRREKKHRPTDDQRVDEGIDESFPASDPPAHGGVTTGAPKDHKSGKETKNTSDKTKS